jgi:hypothetical protein
MPPANDSTRAIFLERFSRDTEAGASSNSYYASKSLSCMDFPLFFPDLGIAFKHYAQYGT